MIKVNITSIVCVWHFYTAATLIDILTLTQSPTVTQSPLMIGGVNVAAAVAISVVLVLLLIVIGVVVGVSFYLCYHIRRGLKLT